MNFEQFSQRYGIWIVSVLMLLVLLVPLLTRLSEDAPITPNAQSYYHLRQSEMMLDGSIGFDQLRNEYMIPTPYTLLLSLMLVFGVPWLLPALLALCLLPLLHIYIAPKVRKKSILFVFLLCVALSPVVSVLGTSHSPILLATIFLLLSRILFRQNVYIASILLFLGLVTSPVLGLGVLCCFIVLYRKKPLELVMSIAAVAIAGLWFFLWSRSFPISFSTINPIGFDTILFELGNSSGVSVFLVVLGAVGLFSSRLQNRIFLGFSLVCLFLLSIILQDFIIAAVLLLSFLASFAVYDLIFKKWELELIRQSLTVLICCIGLFLLIVCIRERIAEQPTSDFISSMTYLDDVRRPGKVLSLPEYAPMIEYFSGRRVTLKENSPIDLFFSSESQNVYSFLEGTETTYIFITDEMIDSVFTRSDEGILFLLPNAQRFILVHEVGNNQLWYYIRR